MIVTVTLNPAVDHTVLLRQFKIGRLNRAQEVFYAAGGKGLNVSKAVCELGGQTLALTVLGGPLAPFWKTETAQAGVPCVALTSRGPSRLNSVILCEGGRVETRINEGGAPVEPKTIRQVLQRLLRMKKKISFCVLSGSLPAKTDGTVYKEMIWRLQSAGIPCVLDTDGAALREGIKAKPVMIKPNQAELEYLSGMKFRKPEDCLQSARGLLGKGIRIVAVSFGKQGCLFVSQHQTIRVRVPQVSVQSARGAGDCLVGGFLLGLIKKLSFPDAIRLGVAASLSAVSRQGPRLCVKKDIPKHWKKIRLTELRSERLGTV